MQSEQQFENFLFAAPSPIAHSVDLVGTSPAAALVAPSKRPLPPFGKPSRSARLGAAAAAALAACGNDDLDADGGSSPEPLLADCLLSPDVAPDASDANWRITSLLGSMPALPGSPTLETSDTQTPPRLIKQFSALSLLRGRASTGTTVCRGTAQVQREMYSPVAYLGKCQSERFVTGVGVNGSVSGGCDGGARPANYDMVAAVAAVRMMRALSRKSVDAAADAVTLATRQVSELSLAAAAAAVSGGEEAGVRAAVAVAASSEESGEGRERGGGGAVGEPTPLPGVNNLAEGGVATARARIGLSSALGMAPVVAVDTLTGRGLVMPAQNRVGVMPGHAGCTASAVQYKIPQDSSSPSLPSKQHRRLPVHSGTEPPPQDMVVAAGEEAPGGLRRRESEMHGRPKWLERLMRAFNSDRAYRAGKGSAGGGVGDGQHGCSTAGGGDGVGSAEGMGDGSDGGNGAPGDLGDEEEDDEGVRKARAGNSGGGEGRGSCSGAVKADNDGRASGGGSDPGISTCNGRSGANAARSTRDQFLAATRLLSSRLGRSPRPGCEQPPPAVTASRDSTTVHRARLAQQARLPRVAALANTPNCPQVGVTHVEKHGFVAGFASKSGSGGGGGSAAAATAVVAGARVMGVSVTAYAHAASATTTSLAMGTPAAVASSFAGPVDIRQVHFSTPYGAGANLHNSRESAVHSVRMLRQVSAPGGPEPDFTSLSQLETRSVDGAECLTNSAAVDCDSDLVNDDDNTCVAHRTAAMTFSMTSGAKPLGGGVV